MIMRPGKWLSTKQRVTKPLRLLLNDIEDLSRVVALGKITHDVGLFRGDHHANLLGAGGNHAFDQILGHGFRTLCSINYSRSHGQKLLRAAERLDALTSAGGRNDPDHATSPFAIDNCCCCEQPIASSM